MNHLNEIVEHVVRGHLNVSETEFGYLTHPDPSHLHSPFSFKGMKELVACLHAFRKQQEKDPGLLLLVDGDYDTDGICGATVLTASLSLFGFRFRVHVPTMEEGYGLSRMAIDRMKSIHEADGDRIGLILTADNGISAFSGIAYAKSLHIPVLVTDHHPPKDRLPDAAAIVDPWQEGDLYPFKGNSGACVAWKAMLAYAEMYQPDALEAVGRLIVFAGMSNVADVMPIRGENRYMVSAALRIIKGLLSVGTVPYPDYKAMSDTGCAGYDTVFHGLYDLITLLQESKDKARAKKRKGPVPLPLNEELFSYYLSPLLNAPRRVHDTCLEGLSPFMVSDPGTRRYIIQRLIALNEEKSRLRDQALGAIGDENDQLMLCLNTKKGISGLVAGELSKHSPLPRIIFSCEDPQARDVLYGELPDKETITGSGRSNEYCPLDKILEKVCRQHPELAISWGGHRTAAGVTIRTKDFQAFYRAVGSVLPEVHQEAMAEMETIPVPANRIRLDIRKEGISAVYETMERGMLVEKETALDARSLAADARKAVEFLESLRPFGKDYLEETVFEVRFDTGIYGYDWNPGFWKTFKCSVHGVELLTFDKPWADEVKQALEGGNPIFAEGTLKLNEFRGKVTPQILLRRKENP